MHQKPREWPCLVKHKKAQEQQRKHDSSNYGSSNNSSSDNNDFSKADQKLLAIIKSSKNKQANIKQAVATHKELLATIPVPSA
eukprot:1301767-Ditylum_brightwellii.AAC.1